MSTELRTVWFSAIATWLRATDLAALDGTSKLYLGSSVVTLNGDPSHLLHTSPLVDSAFGPLRGAVWRSPAPQALLVFVFVFSPPPVPLRLPDPPFNER